MLIVWFVCFLQPVPVLSQRFYWVKNSATPLYTANIYTSATELMSSPVPLCRLVGWLVGLNRFFWKNWMKDDHRIDHIHFCRFGQRDGSRNFISLPLTLWGRTFFNIFVKNIFEYCMDLDWIGLGWIKGDYWALAEVCTLPSAILIAVQLAPTEWHISALPL